jgi:hypothetical protein
LSSNVVLLARIRLDVEDLGVTVHGGGAATRPRKELRAALATTARRHVGKIGAELLPTHCDEIGAAEGQQRVPPPRIAPAEQQIGLINAVDRPE